MMEMMLEGFGELLLYRTLVVSRVSYSNHHRQHYLITNYHCSMLSVQQFVPNHALPIDVVEDDSGWVDRRVQAGRPFYFLL